MDETPTRVYLRLNRSELAALVVAARENYRHPKDEARRIVVAALKAEGRLPAPGEERDR